MSFLDELKEIKKRFLPWFHAFILISLFFFCFGFRKFSFFRKNIFLPFPTVNSISAQFFLKIKKDLLPENVQLVALSPISAFLVQIVISLFFGFIFTFPYFVFQFFSYLSPALYENEKKYIFKILIPSSFLFLLGCLFSYFFLIPFTFKILYSFTSVLEVTPFFDLDKFLTLILGLMFATGILFLTPIFMALLSYFNLVSLNFWKKNWQIAFFIFIVISAIITPDGSGITQLILSFILTGLYFLGYILSKVFKKVEIKK
jgi:sec-independent protein translocase protein TatC